MLHLIQGKARWWALYVLCMGTLMIVLDSTIVTVALPSIRSSLGFSETSLAWVMNAYLLTFGGFLLLGGRLGDFFGHRKVFLVGLAVFTLASLACGVAESQWVLIASRAVQGIGGAVVDSVALSLIMTLFAEPNDRAKAMGVFGTVCAAGGSVGVLLGGVLTSGFDWHWVFLVNIPMGLLTAVLIMRLLPALPPTDKQKLDIAGAILVTASLMLAVYAIVGGSAAGWASAETLGLLAGAVFLMLLFLWTENRLAAPLVPLAMFRLRNLATANVMGVLWAAGMFAWFFLSALYLQLVLGYDPMQVGLAFLPSNIIMAALSIGISAKLVTRFGIKRPLIAGLAAATLGLLLLARAPVHGDFVIDVLPSMILLGIGAGIAFNPILLAAMNDAKPNEAGLASGLVNTSFMMGGALGLAILVSIAAARTSGMLAEGTEQIEALNSGYQAAFFVGSLFTLVAVLLGIFVLREERIVLSAEVLSA
jgi:EmrB/QacA subfamily drug resistance transporter